MTSVFQLHINNCPDCGKKFKKFFTTYEQPWCTECDIYWERIGSMWCANCNARELYDEYVKSLSVYHQDKKDKK